MDRSRRSWFGITLLLRGGDCVVMMYGCLMVCASTAQVATTANSEYHTPAQRAKAASEMDPWNRGALERTDALVDSLGLHAGETIADVGTGVGHLLPYIMRRIGNSGTIFAVDIYPEFVDKTRERIAAEGWGNVHALLGTDRDPKLPANLLDGAILLDTYHHLDYPQATLRGVRRALKSSGRLFVIDYYRYRKHPAANPEILRRHIRLDRDDVVNEVEAEGFHLAAQFDHMPFMYVLIFEKR